MLLPRGSGLLGHVGYVPHDIEPLRSCGEVWQSTGLRWHRGVDLGKLYTVHLLRFHCGAKTDQVVLVHGEVYNSICGVIGYLLTLNQITTIAAGTLIVVMHPKFGSSQWRPFRAFMFVAMGLSAIAPVIHGLQVYGFQQLEEQMGLSRVVAQGVLYIVGAVLYAVRLIIVVKKRDRC